MSPSSNTAYDAFDISYWGSSTDVSSAKFALKWNEAGRKLYVIAQVADSDHVFTESYGPWNAGDRLEVYSQGEPIGGAGYAGVYGLAEQYYVAPTNTGCSWAT